MERLRASGERQAQVVELRFFGGLSVRDTARMLGVSERTVELDWRMARAWLRQALEESHPEDIAELIEAPQLDSHRERVAIRLLMEIFPAAFLSGSGDLSPGSLRAASMSSLRASALSIFVNRAKCQWARMPLGVPSA